MKISKIISAIIVVGGLAILGATPSNAILGFSSDWNSQKAQAALDQIANKLSPEYMQSKDYSQIKDAKLKEGVQNMCKYGCNRVTCKQAAIHEGCEKICPGSSVKNCLAAKVGS